MNQYSYGVIDSIMAEWLLIEALVTLVSSSSKEFTLAQKLYHWRPLLNL